MIRLNWKLASRATATAALGIVLLGSALSFSQEGPPPQDAPPPPPGFTDYGYRLDDFAARNGYADGFGDGQKDRVNGHSFRPTHDDRYKDAPGFHAGRYARDEYKRVYRESYVHGYERGYKRG